MKYLKYKLDFPQGYHVSNFRLSDSNIKISADVLFSAIVHEANNMGGQEAVDKLVKLFNENSLIISDLFPYIEDKLYIPKPYFITEREKEDLDYKKKLNRLEFIEFNKIEDWFRGKLILDGECFNLKNEDIFMGKHRVSTKIKHSKDGQHDIYNVGSYKFNNDLSRGLYFVFGYKDMDDLFFFDDLMYSLSFSGLGGKRTSGLGRFNFTYDELEKEYERLINNKTNLNILLTTSIPKKTELSAVLDSRASYKLIRKGGFIKPKKGENVIENHRKKDIYFFDSGSTFEQTYLGDIYRVDNSYKHPIYRYGSSMFIGVEI